MSTEKRISNVRLVEEYAARLEGLLPPNIVIGQALGLTPKQVGTAIDKSRKQKTRQIPEVLLYDGTNNRRNQAIMLAKGNIWPDIEPYAQMGMRAREIHEALLLDRDRDLKGESINQGLIHRRNRGHLDKVTDEEKDNVYRTVIKATDEQVRGRVRTWLGLRGLLAANGLETGAYKRMDWMPLINLVVLPTETNSGFFDFSPVMNFFEERQAVKFVFRFVPPEFSYQANLSQTETPLVDKSLDSRQLPFYFDKGKWANLNFFAAKLANLALDSSWSTKADQRAVADNLKQAGIPIPAELRLLINRVGFAAETTTIGSNLAHGFMRPKSEYHVSEEQYLRYATYYLILVKHGLEISEDPLKITVSGYQARIVELLKKHEVQKYIRGWGVQLEGLVGQLKVK